MTQISEGVVAAIQRKLQGQAKDENYLRTLIHAGALDVLVDGLNEATPDARSRISRFAEDSFKGNFVLTTQPTSWEPPRSTRVYVLQPLLPKQVEDFLEQQWKLVEPGATVGVRAYNKAVKDFVATLKSETEGEDKTSRDLPIEALSILCNPMEAALAAERLARGENPDVFRLVEQCFQGAATVFRQRHNREFRKEQFAERVYEWRLSGEPNLNVEGFEEESSVLVDHKLLLCLTETLKNQKETKDVTKWMFRHDKIMNFFMVPAFLDPHADRRMKHVGDEPFGGVYDLLAIELPLAKAEELQRFLVDWSATTNENELLNRFTRRLNQRNGRK